MRPWSYITRRWSTRLWPLLLALAVSGCRSVNDVQVRTEYRTLYERDSVWVDCTDTFYVVERGDTVRITEKLTEREYHYKVLHDTMAVTDTVMIETKTMGNADCPKKRIWPWFLAGFFIGIFIIFAAKICIKIFLKK